jgi:hypothetical protein
MWNATQLYTAGILSVNVVGDYNGDGVVDTADYIALRKSGATTSDHDVWRSHFGHASGSGASSSAEPWLATVPEPTAAWLIAACLWLGPAFRVKAMQR